MNFRKNIPVRRERPSIQSQHRWYLSELRCDFYERCWYCDLHDSQMWWTEQFEVDHFIPTSIDATKRLEYSNLIYSCKICNRFKSGKFNAIAPCFIDPINIEYWDFFSYSTDLQFICNNSNENAKYIFKELKFYLLLRQKLNILNEFYYIESELWKIKDYNDDMWRLYHKINQFKQKLYS